MAHCLIPCNFSLLCDQQMCCKLIQKENKSSNSYQCGCQIVSQIRWEIKLKSFVECSLSTALLIEGSKDIASVNEDTHAPAAHACKVYVSCVHECLCALCTHVDAREAVRCLPLSLSALLS